MTGETPTTADCSCGQGKMTLLAMPLIWVCDTCGERVKDEDVCRHEMQPVWEDAYGTHGGDCRLCGAGPL